MTIPLTDTLVPLGTFPIVYDTNLLAGYRSVADIAERDAIPIAGVASIASQRQAGMVVWVRSEQKAYRLGPGLTNADWELAELLSGPGVTDVYLSGANGNDANDGLTPGTAVATFSRVWELLPQFVLAPFVVHIGDQGGGGYTYEAPPEDRVFAEGAFIVLYGDGAGQGGEDGFNEIAAGAAGAATTTSVLELAVDPGSDVVRGYTVQYTSGAASGCRRMIRNNAGVLATLVDVTSSDTAVLTPVPGDTYRVLEPSAVLLMPEVATTGFGGVSVSLTFLSNRAPVHLVNIKMDAPGAFPFFGRNLTTNARTIFFGVVVEDPTNLSISSSSPVVAGISDPSYLETYLLYDAIGHTHVGGDWQGWGLAWLNLVASKDCLIDFFNKVSNQGFEGFIVAAQLNFTNSAPVTLRGGSAIRISQTAHENLTLLLAPLVGTAVPFLLGSTALVTTANVWSASQNSTLTIVNTGLPLALDVVSDSVIGNVFSIEASRLVGELDISITAGSVTSGVIINATRGSDIIASGGTISIDATGSSGCYAISAANNSRLNLPEISFTSVPNGFSVSDSSLTYTFSGTSLVVTDTMLQLFSSMVEMDADLSSAILVEQVGGSCDLSGTLVGDDASYVIQIQSGAKFSCGGSITNNNGAGDALRVSGGSTALLSSSIAMTAAEYCINTQFGGRAFFYGAPVPANFNSGFSDIIVDGVTTSAVAALAASGSSVVSADGLGSVSRAD